MADDGNGRPQGGEDPLGANAGPGSGGLLRTLIGEEGDRKPRLIGLAGVVVVLLILGAYAAVNHRATERRNLVVLGAVVAENTAEARITVLRQDVLDGAVVTHLRWAEVNPMGAEGKAKELTIHGETVHVDVQQATVLHRKLDDPIEIAYFASLTPGGQEPLPVVGDGGPDYYRYQGERAGSIKRTSRRLWRVLRGERPAPGYLDVTGRALAGLDLPLLIGEQWELTLGPTGTVEIQRDRSPRDGFDAFELSTPVLTSNGLEVTLEEAPRHVEFAEQLDRELVFQRVRVRLENQGAGPLTVDPNLFQLQDDRGQVFRPTTNSRVQLAAGGGQTLRLRFKVPPTSRTLRFTIPGETVADTENQPLAVFLSRDEAFIGSMEPVGDLLASLDHVERGVEDDQFIVVASMTLANLTWEAVTLDPDRFHLENLRFAGDESVEATELSTTELAPFFPEQVAITFPIGDSLERGDLRLRVEAARKKVAHPAATFNLVPLAEGATDPDAGRRFVSQLCGARHYYSYDELMFGGPRGVLGLLSDKKAREKEALRHLDLASSFFADSVVIATAPR